MDEPTYHATKAEAHAAAPPGATIVNITRKRAVASIDDIIRTTTREADDD